MTNNKKIIFMMFVLITGNLLFKPLKGETILNSSDGYIKKEILFMEWGDDTNEVELVEENVEDDYAGDKQKDVVRITPKGIKVDGKANVYFEDIVKGKVVKYNPQNNKIEKYEGNEGFLKILVDKEQDGLYIFNSKDNTVDIILTGKDRIRKVDRSISDYLVKSEMRIVKKVLFSGNKKKIVFDGADTSNINLQEEETAKEYDLKAKNSLVKFKIIEPLHNLIFYNLKQIGAACDEIKYRNDQSPDYQGFINTDKDKNIYYLFSRQQDDQIEYFIVKINPALCKIDIILLDIDDFTGYMASPTDYVDVDLNGNIYQLINKEDGVHVLSWGK